MKTEITTRKDAFAPKQIIISVESLDEWHTWTNIFGLCDSIPAALESFSTHGNVDPKELINSVYSAMNREEVR